MKKVENTILETTPQNRLANSVIPMHMMTLGKTISKWKKADFKNSEPPPGRAGLGAEVRAAVGLQGEDWGWRREHSLKGLVHHS